MHASHCLGIIGNICSEHYWSISVKMCHNYVGAVVTLTRNSLETSTIISKMRCLLVFITAGFLDMQVQRIYGAFARNISDSVALERWTQTAG